jgi:hypothetical protein
MGEEFTDVEWFNKKNIPGFTDRIRKILILW